MPVSITREPIDLTALRQRALHPQAGAVLIFCGDIRNHSDNQSVDKLEYESHESMALNQMDQVAEETYRVTIHEALKHLIITGNALLYMPDDGGMRVFHLDRFVIERDPMGNVLKIATKESIAKAALDEDLREAVLQTTGYAGSSDDTCDLYTAICLSLIHISEPTRLLSSSYSVCSM